VAVLRCDSCGGETFEPLSDPGYFRCHNCGVSSTVKLAAAARPTGIRLVSAGPRKIEVIKVIRAHTGWDLKQAKGLVDAVDASPQTVPGIPGDPGSAERLAEELARAGAVVERG
jgi:ribosomal protein L7/L12